MAQGIKEDNMGVLNRPAIKYEARNFISTDTRWIKMFFATVIVYLLNNGVRYAFSIKNIFSDGIYYFDDYYNQGETSVWGSLSWVVSLVLIPFAVAIAGYYLNHIRGFNPEWKSLYKEGFDRFGKYLATVLITEIITTLWTFLFIVPGIIKFYAYSQVKYIIHDNCNLNAKDARKMSEIMTNGFKSDLFVLDLSFILWYMLVACAAGIASVYVTPYVETTKAMYYENLKKNAIDSGLISPESFGIQPVAPENGFGGDGSVGNDGFMYGGEGIDADFTVEDKTTSETENGSDNQENL